MIKSEDISVVVQGAIDKVNTPKCLESIRKILPRAEIVLSTWEKSDVNGLDYDILVLNKDPGGVIMDDVYNVLNNVNRQILSTKNGILKCHRPYILKIRSDIKLKNTKFIKAFDKFPSRSQNCSILKKRVVINNFYCANPYKTNFLFHVSDWVFFGLAEDVQNIWDIPLQPEPKFSRYFEKRKRPKTDPIPSWLFKYIPEQYIWVTFLRKNGEKIKFDYFSDVSEKATNLSELSFANNVIILNYEDYGIKFLKFNPYKWDTKAQYTHNDWLKLYKKYCDEKFEYPLSFYLNETGAVKKCVLSLKKHVHKFLKPLKSFLHWLSEPFSVLYYSIKFMIKYATAILQFFKGKI